MRLLNRTLAMLGLVGTLSLSLLAPVQAADYWYYVGADIHDNTTSIDNSSVDKEDDVAQLWIRVIQPGGDYYFEKKWKLRRMNAPSNPWICSISIKPASLTIKREYTYDSKSGRHSGRHYRRIAV